MFKAEAIPFTIMGNPFHLTDEVCHRLHDCGCVRYDGGLRNGQYVYDKVVLDN